MKISQISLHQNSDGLYFVKINHNDRKVQSGTHLRADDAYSDAAKRLVISPGYVAVVLRGKC